MNLSFVIPFYHRAAWFRQMLPLNHAFTHASAEVVCVLDDSADESAVMAIVRENTHIRFRVIVNDDPHDWRPPCVAINVGVRHATASHVVVMSPESVLCLSHPELLMQLAGADWRRAYVGLKWDVPGIELGEPTAMTELRLREHEAFYGPASWGFGFVMFPKYAFERIMGMDESREKWGNDDMDLRVRLVRSGNPCSVDSRIKLFHAYHDGTSGHRPGEVQEPLACNVALDRQPAWGREFSRVAYDYVAH